MTVAACRLLWRAALTRPGASSRRLQGVGRALTVRRAGMKMRDEWMKMGDEWMKMRDEWLCLKDSACCPRFRLEHLFDHQTDTIAAQIFRRLGRAPPSQQRIAAWLKRTGTEINSHKHRSVVTENHGGRKPEAGGAQARDVVRLGLDALEAKIDPRKTVRPCCGMAGQTRQTAGQASQKKSLEKKQH
jgi:hypothetical protein